LVSYCRVSQLDEFRPVLTDNARCFRVAGSYILPAVDEHLPERDTPPVTTRVSSVASRNVPGHDPASFNRARYAWSAPSSVACCHTLFFSSGVVASAMSASQSCDGV